MRSDTAEVVERLRDGADLTWLSLIDRAQLDEPVEQEPDPGSVVWPYRWLIQRIGEGVKLTQAGYLPPALVTEIVLELGWREEWIGKQNREDLTPRVSDLRESAQRSGLLRKYRGRLLVTKLGRELAGDPARLWWHLAAKLPDGRSAVERQAGVLFLIVVAAGQPYDGDLLADGLSRLGWMDREPYGGTYGAVSSTSAFSAARDTWAMFDRLRLLARIRLYGPEEPPTPGAVLLARAALIGPDGGATSAATVEEPRPTAEQAVQLTVTLRNVDPPIWRRLLVPASLTLAELHPVIQIAMGWENRHLHMFDVAGTYYGDTEELDLPTGDPESVTVGQLAVQVSGLDYEYDFGDSWHHEIRIEQVMASVGPVTPTVLAGARACPPEDCGGPWGYLDLLEALADPTHEEHDHLASWVGRPLEPEAFDLDETKAMIDLHDRQIRRRRGREG